MNANARFARFDALRTQFPPRQFLRYILVGLWNTCFGYSTYAALTALLGRFGKNSYLAAMLLSAPFNITVAFLAYKWFVFKTKGNYLKEWLGCFSVYGGTMILSFLALPPLVILFRRLMTDDRPAPYLAGAVLAGATVVISYFGHRNISFRKGRDGTVVSPSPMQSDRQLRSGSFR